MTLDGEAGTSASGGRVASFLATARIYGSWRMCVIFVMTAIREQVAFLKDDRPLGPDITMMGTLIGEGWFRESFLDSHDLMAAGI